MNTKIKKLIYSILIICSVILLFFCSWELINSLVTYKYHIEANFDHVSTGIPYESRKVEIEMIMSYITIIIVYLLIVSGFFLYWTTKTKGIFKLIIIIVSISLLVFCFTGLAHYVEEYSRCIKSNFNHSDLIYSYKSQKTEMDLILGYLKIFIAYLLVVICYFVYKLSSVR